MITSCWSQLRTPELPNFYLLSVCAHDLILHDPRRAGRLFLFLPLEGLILIKCFVLSISTHMWMRQRQNKAGQCRRKCVRSVWAMWDGWEAANGKGECGAQREGGKEGGWEKAGVSARHAPGISYLKFSRSAPLKPPQRTAHRRQREERTFEDALREDAPLLMTRGSDEDTQMKWEQPWELFVFLFFFKQERKSRPLPDFKSPSPSNQVGGSICPISTSTLKKKEKSSGSLETNTKCVELETKGWFSEAACECQGCFLGVFGAGGVSVGGFPDHK